MSDKLIVNILSKKIEVIPGKNTEVKVIIKNVSNVDDSYNVVVDGIDPKWYTLSATSIPLSSGDTSELTLTIKPPLISSGEAKRYFANFIVSSTKDSSIKTTVPIEMPVGSLLDFDLQIIPQQQRGRKGSYTLIITNNGDKPTTYNLEGKDHYNTCRFQFKKSTIEVQPSKTVKVALSVEPIDRPIRGSAEVYKFRVIVTPQGSLPYQSKIVKGELTYKPVLKTIHAFLLIVTIIVVASTISALTPQISNLVQSGPSTQYTLAMNMDGYGAITGYGTFNEGDEVPIRANAAPKWEFVEWSGDIDTISNYLSSRTTIVMDSNYLITANFQPREITPHTVYDIVLDHTWPATLIYGDWVKINFNYTIEWNFYSEGADDIDIVPDAHILARPFSNGALSPGYLVRGYNFVRPWDKEGESEFTINSQPGEVIVDQIRFQITNADKTIIFNEFFVPVYFTFQQDPSLEYEE